MAIKRVRGDLVKPHRAAAVSDEARSIAAISHFNIVQVLDYGRDGEGPFLILEYVDGRNLQETLKDGPLELERAVRDRLPAVRRRCRRAHERGVIHRDIKPANILLTSRGEPKLTDFGLARQERRTANGPAAGAVLGDARLHAARATTGRQQADARSDLWSLAATTYQMLTGKSPKVIRLDSVPESLKDVLGKRPETPVGPLPDGGRVQGRPARALHAKRRKSAAGNSGPRKKGSVAAAEK